LKTVSDDLFRLIKALTKSEKGYFKKFAARNAPGTTKNYIVLFNAVDALKEYDEDKLRNNLKDTALIKQLAVYKVYLYNLILKALQSYGMFDNSETRLNEMIANVRTLESKALYREALKLLKKAKEIAYKYNRAKYILDILIMERNLMIAHPDKNVLENRQRIYNEQRAFLKSVAKYFEYSWLSDRTVIYIEQKGDFNEAERVKEIEKIMASPLLNDESLADDYLTKTYFYHAHLFYNLSQNRLDKVHEILYKEIKMMEESKHMIDEAPKNYISALINFLLFSNVTNKKESVRETLVKINSLRRKWKNKLSPALEIHITFHAANSEMLVYRKNIELPKGRNVIRRIEDDLKKYDKEIPLQLKASLLSNIVSFNILDNDFEQALKFNNMILNDAQLSFKNDVINLAKLCLLLIHFELENFDLLEYVIESTNRFFKSRTRILPAEQALLSFFKRAIASNEDELDEALEELKYNLDKSLKDPGSSSLLDMFDFISWAESKLKRKKLPEILKQKMG
jgi:hypothetical protein